MNLSAETSPTNQLLMQAKTYEPNQPLLCGISLYFRYTSSSIKKTYENSLLLPQQSHATFLQPHPHSIPLQPHQNRFFKHSTPSDPISGCILSSLPMTRPLKNSKTRPQTFKSQNHHLYDPNSTFTFTPVSLATSQY